MSKQFWIIIVLLFSAAFAIVDNDTSDKSFNPPEIKKGSVLTVEDCVSAAYKNNPKIKRKKYELDIAKSNVKIAKSAYFPVISTGVGFNFEKNSNSVYYDKKYRDLPNVALAVNKMIWDFGRTTSMIKMEEFYKIVAQYEFTDELCHSLFDIKAKYYNLLKTIALDKIAKENIELNKKIFDISHGDTDKTTAQVYLSEANAKQINTDGDIDIAKLNLNNSMYLPERIDFSISNTATFYDYDIKLPFKPLNFPFNKNEAADIAYKNSPDLAILVNTKSAMEQSLRYIKKTYLPELSAGIGYGLNNTNFATNNSMQLGVGLASNINIMELKSNIDKAKSELNIADNEILLFKKDLYYEVLRALSNVDCFEKQIPKLHKEISDANDNLNLAIKNYKLNKIDYIALQDARKDYINAKEKYILCLYDYNMSIIQTEMAMHYHMVDIHHKAEHALEHHSDELIEHLNDALDCKGKPKENSKKQKTRNKK